MTAAIGEPDLLRRDALAILKAALEAADARNAVRRHLAIRADVLVAGTVELSLSSFDEITLLSIGKAAVPMAAGVRDVLGAAIARELIVTKAGHAGPDATVIEAGHPIPNAESFRAAKSVHQLVSGLSERHLLILAVSGGASALLAAPAEPITLAGKQMTTDLLLRAGADIYELNAVRKHLSTLKGGRLAALAFPATVLALLLSDVIGDPPDVIGSGLAAADPSTFADAAAVLHKFELWDRVPIAVRRHLECGLSGNVPETPKAGDGTLAKVRTVVVGSNRLALEAAQSMASALGYTASIVSSTLSGETRDVARVQAELIKNVWAPVCLLSGGETTVTVRGQGKGGRNQEYALAAVPVIAGSGGVLILSAGTDGTDGATDAAGAIATGKTLVTRTGAWPVRRGPPFAERLLSVLRRSRRLGEDRPDRDQRDGHPNHAFPNCAFSKKLRELSPCFTKRTLRRVA